MANQACIHAIRCRSGLIPRLIGKSTKQLEVLPRHVSLVSARAYSADLPDAIKRAQGTVFRKTKDVTKDSVKVEGYDFNKGIDYQALLESYTTSGFQATNFGLAVKEINKMIKKKAEPIQHVSDVPYPFKKKKTNCTIFLGFTSNLMSSGVREHIRYLVQHDMVDCIVTSAGGIEEDFIKCMGPTTVGDFQLSGAKLLEGGLNRIGNLIVPSDNYRKFKEWIYPIIDQMLIEQQTEGTNWTPSKMIARLGKEIDNPESVYYWAYKNYFHPLYHPEMFKCGLQKDE
ncbi:deoxyhypusine synthase-like [Saccoglossus kowalevskii]